jgi:hypothetical protein
MHFELQRRINTFLLGRRIDKLTRAWRTLFGVFVFSLDIFTVETKDACIISVRIFLEKGSWDKACRWWVLLALNFRNRVWKCELFPVVMVRVDRVSEVMVIDHPLTFIILRNLYLMNSFQHVSSIHFLGFNRLVYEFLANYFLQIPFPSQSDVKFANRA